MQATKTKQVIYQPYIQEHVLLGVKRNGHLELKHHISDWFDNKSSCKQNDYATNCQCSFMGHWLQHRNHPQQFLFVPILRLGADLAKKRGIGLHFYWIDSLT